MASKCTQKINHTKPCQHYHYICNSRTTMIKKVLKKKKQAEKKKDGMEEGLQ
jgi:hypothetical protein